MHFADNVGQDQPAHQCSLIWAYSVDQHILQYPLILQADNASISFLFVNILMLLLEENTQIRYTI